MRCNSLGDLYPITSWPHHSSMSHSSFTTFSPTLWYNRFGHADPSILCTLYYHHLISCNKYLDNFLCHSSPLGKQTKLSFTKSLNFNVFPFDIIHKDLWTSSVPSCGGYCYYVLFLDNFTNFLWHLIFHINIKLSIFNKFHHYITTQFE